MCSLVALIIILGSPPHDHCFCAVEKRFERIERRSYIEQSHGIVLFHFSAIVVVDDVADVASTTIHYPVVPVEW